jgi:hypothetical protein
MVKLESQQLTEISEEWDQLKLKHILLSAVVAASALAGQIDYIQNYKDNPVSTKISANQKTDYKAPKVRIINNFPEKV